MGNRAQLASGVALGSDEQCNTQMGVFFGGS